jgi:transcriptional regulator with XRE-family HTH domain
VRFFNITPFGIECKLNWNIFLFFIFLMICEGKMGRNLKQEKSKEAMELVAFRKSIGLSQKDLAEKIGMLQGTYAKYELSTRHTAALVESLQKLGYLNNQPAPSPVNLPQQQLDVTTELAVYKALYKRSEEQLKNLSERFAKALEACARAKIEDREHIQRGKVGAIPSGGVHK